MHYLFIAVLCFLLPLQARAIEFFFGGFEFEKSNDQSGSRECPSGQKKPPSCLSVYEYSRIGNFKSIYSIDKFNALIKSQAGIANIFSKQLGFSVLSLVSDFEAKFSQEQLKNHCVEYKHLQKFNSFSLAIDSKYYIPHAKYNILRYKTRDLSDGVREGRRLWHDKTVELDSCSSDDLLSASRTFLKNYRMCGRLSQFFLANDEANDKRTVHIRNVPRVHCQKNASKEKPWQAKKDQLSPILLKNMLGIREEKARFIRGLRQRDLQASKDVWETKKMYDRQIEESRGRKANFFQQALLLKAEDHLARLDYHDLDQYCKEHFCAAETLFKLEQMRSVHEYGIIPLKNEKNKILIEMVRSWLEFYQKNVTDHLIDENLKFSFHLSLKELLPFSERRYKVFKIAKACDGSLLAANTFVGLVLAPFSLGLSHFASAGLNVAIMAIFSILDSMIKGQPTHAIAGRLGPHLVLSFAEQMTPILSQFNSLYTAIDELRIASRLDQRVKRKLKKNDNDEGLKVHPEALGKPFVLGFIRERCTYLSTHLVPKIRGIYLDENTYGHKKEQVEIILNKLTEARIELYKWRSLAGLRYQFLQENGQIPGHLVLSVRMALEEEHEFLNRLDPSGLKNDDLCN